MSEDKSLADKAVSIKGKQYVLVQDRVLYFNQEYPKGSIETSATFYPEVKMWVVKATVRPIWDEDDRVFTGYSQAVVGQGMVNQTAALENAETSAVGRALAFMGIGVIESIASADEVVKATNAPVAAKIAPRTTEAETRIKAAKDRIMDGLRKYGAVLGPKPDKAVCVKAVRDITGLDLEDQSQANLDAIGEAIWAKVEAREAKE